MDRKDYMLYLENLWTCTKCNMNMWSDEILDNDWCKHHMPYRDTDDYKNSTK
jgi:hypothetical protein